MICKHIWDVNPLPNGSRLHQLGLIEYNTELSYRMVAEHARGRIAMSLSGEQVRAIEEFAARKYNEMDSTHGWNHGLRTARLATYLAEREHADPLVCRMGALLHQYHPELAGMVDDFLQSISVDPSLRERIVHCVECVEPETIGRARTPEARIVFDADKLQTLGPFGLVREVAYRVLGRGVDFRRAVRESGQVQETMRSLLQTDSARRLAASIHDVTQQVFSLIDSWDRLSFLEQPSSRNE